MRRLNSYSESFFTNFECFCLFGRETERLLIFTRFFRPAYGFDASKVSNADRSVCRPFVGPLSVPINQKLQFRSTKLPPKGFSLNKPLSRTLSLPPAKNFPEKSRSNATTPPPFRGENPFMGQIRHLRLSRREVNVHKTPLAGPILQKSSKLCNLYINFTPKCLKTLRFYRNLTVYYP